MSDAFPYLSVLVSIIIGLGMSHLLGALVRGIHNRTRSRLYWPSLVWGFNLFVLLMLVWWSEFDLNHHEHWTFAIFACTIALPALIYVMCGLILPASETRTSDDMRSLYNENRAWFFSLHAAAIALSFLQTYLLDGTIRADIDSTLKILILAFALVMVFQSADRLQKIAAIVNLTWLLSYIAILFGTLRT